MAKRETRGRHSIFRGKNGGVRVQGIITRKGGAAFERRRARLEALYKAILGVPPTSVSDADVIEFDARGEDETAEYLRTLRP